jgi:uncharacterized protein DUF6702
VIRLVTIAALLLAAPLAVSAHTFHQSRTEISHNTKAGTLEIILQIHIDDIEAHLAEKLGRQIDLGAMPNTRSVVEPYVRQVFALTGPNGKPVTLNWIGAEVSRHFIDIYLEAPADPLPESLRNEIMNELPDQRNLVNLRTDNRPPGKTTTLTPSRTRLPLNY